MNFHSDLVKLPPKGAGSFSISGAGPKFKILLFTTKALRRKVNYSLRLSVLAVIGTFGNRF